MKKKPEELLKELLEQEGIKQDIEGKNKSWLLNVILYRFLPNIFYVFLIPAEGLDKEERRMRRALQILGVLKEIAFTTGQFVMIASFYFFITKVDPAISDLSLPQSSYEKVEKMFIMMIIASLLVFAVGAVANDAFRFLLNLFFARRMKKLLGDKKEGEKEGEFPER